MVYQLVCKAAVILTYFWGQGSIKWYNCLGRQFGSFLEDKHTLSTPRPANPLLGIPVKVMEEKKRNLPRMFAGALFIAAKLETTQMSVKE